ncbi:hypothetical protein ACOSP7_008746 [Xanthoceras sorbifolium]
MPKFVSCVQFLLKEVTSNEILLRQIAICNNVAFAYPELLQLTWISHDLLAFFYEALVCACRLPMWCEQIMKFDTTIPWSEPLEATFIPKTLYQENP